MCKIKEESGNRHGKLTVSGRSEEMYDKFGRALWDCVCDCGNTTKVNGGGLRSGNIKSCGCLRAESAAARCGSNNHFWKGGRSVDKRSGYVSLSGQEYPSTVKRYSEAEHRIVMARHLGRPLMDFEEVHHINGVRDDNRISNLELWTKSQPAGIRVEDAVSHAVEMLELYRPDLLKAVHEEYPSEECVWL